MSVASDSSETVKVIIKLGAVPASDMVMHHVLIILTVTFLQGHTDLNHEANLMLDYVRNCSCNVHQVSCENSPRENLCQSDDPDLHSRSQLHLELDK